MIAEWAKLALVCATSWLYWLCRLDQQMASRGEEILLLAADGLTDKEIAEELCISVRTVEGHWRRLREQTGLPNRAGLLGHFFKDQRAQMQTCECSSLKLNLAALEQECERLRESEALIDHEARRHSAILQGEIDRLYTMIENLKEVEEGKTELNAIVLKSSVIAFRFRAEAPYKCLFMSDSIRALGYRPRDFTHDGVPISSLIHPEDFAYAWSEALEQMRSGVLRLDRKYRLLTSRGEPRLVLDRCIYEPATERAKASISVFAFDITHTDLGIGNPARGPFLN